MAPAKGHEIRLVLSAIRQDVKGQAFPGADDLEHPKWPRDGFHVLIATVLSQRTKDANTARAARDLFARFDTPEAIADAPLEDLEGLIRPTGFYKVKAKGLKQLCRKLVDEYGGQVPGTLEDLVALPMVGRKTANCVLSYGLGRPGLCVDTHVHRITNRLGWAETKHADDTELALKKMVPPELWCDVNSLLVRFGQKTCLPRNPRCSGCPVNPYCQYYQKDRSHA